MLFIADRYLPMIVPPSVPVLAEAPVINQPRDAYAQLITPASKSQTIGDGSSKAQGR